MTRTIALRKSLAEATGRDFVLFGGRDGKC
jgi:hypothetical protein